MFWLSILYFSPALAQENDSSPIILEQVNPDYAFQYKLKRLGEKFRNITTNLFNKSKAGDLMLELTQKRAKELLYIADKQKIEHLETATSRYITYTGLLSEASINGFNKVEIINAMEKYVSPLTRLRDKNPAQSAEWLLLQQALDSTNVLISKSRE